MSPFLLRRFALAVLAHRLTPRWGRRAESLERLLQRIAVHWRGYR